MTQMVDQSGRGYLIEAAGIMSVEHKPGVHWAKAQSPESICYLELPQETTAKLFSIA